jgi:hypothetical protein
MTGSPVANTVLNPISTPPRPTTAPSSDSDANQAKPTVRPHSHIGLFTTSPTPALTPTPPDDAGLDGLFVARKASPGLLARMKLLNQHQKSRVVSSPIFGQDKIGKIPESQLRELDILHNRDGSIRIQRLGRAWTGGGPYPQLELQLTGGSVPAMDHDAPPGFDSDHSSVISTSDRVVPSDSEQDDTPDTLGEDTQKYRLPDITKTKSLSQSISETQNSSEQDEAGPTPPPKDVPATQPQGLDGSDTEDQVDVASYFARRSHIARAASIYTLSRVSFTNQIQQLTSISLPPAASLSSSISAIPTSTAAGRALHDAAGQIKVWMTKASEVLNGLDAEDDVEWAAAAGREGLAEVDAAIGRFESLVGVYITAIEELQSRQDIATLPAKDLQRLIGQMDEVVRDWNKIKKTLKDIKSQVEIAMEWEELWNVVLGEIGLEIENLSRLVFEMEERRHRAISESVTESAEKFDIAELETIVEETPRQIKTNNRFSLPPTFSVSSPISPIPQMEQESSKLLALFARMQPLRASLDFLPMRLASFQNRGNKVFPTACDELNRRKEVLEREEKRLEADADALRQELGEDKWVHSFRQAGSKALAMWTSLTKSVQKVRQAIEEQDDEKLSNRIAAYRDKKEHYPPSMRRVLELIDIEMRNRSTVNGEILRIQQDVRQKVTESEKEIQEMDSVLEYFNSTKTLRDSVSTVFSGRTEMSGSAIDTPGSSPASSVVLMSRKSSEYGPSTPNAGRKSRQGSTASSAAKSVPSNRRYSSLPTSVSGVSHIPRQSFGSRLDSMSLSPSRGSSQTSSVRSTTPRSDRPETKPRWNSSVNMNDTVVGHNFKPLSATTPSPHRKSPAVPRNIRSMSTQSAIPVRSPLSRSTTSPPPSTNARPSSTTPSQRPSASKRHSQIQAPSTPSRVSGIRAPSSSSNLSSTLTQSGRRVSPMPEEGEEKDIVEESPTTRPKLGRPNSAMNGRRSSLLPQLKNRTASERVVSTGGRESRVGGAGRDSRAGGRVSSMGSNAEDRPRWKG